MKKIAERLTDLVGNTPLLELNNYNKNKRLKAVLSPNWNILTPPAV